MFANNFAQAPPNAIPRNRATDCTRGDKASAKRATGIFGQDTKNNESAALRLSLFSDAVKLCRPSQSPTFGKCEAFCRHTGSVMSSEVETSLDISVSENSKRLNSFISRVSRRYPRGVTVHVARPARSIPRRSVS